MVPASVGLGSESDIGSAIHEAFKSTGRSWLLHVHVEVSGGYVVLQGEVPSFYIKQLAQETVFTVPGVHGLKNELHVAARAS